MKLADKEMLRRTMARRNVSLADLARAADVSKGFVSHLTSGRKTTCTPQVAYRIAERLDVDLELLFVVSMSSDSGPVNKQRQTRGKVA